MLRSRHLRLFLFITSVPLVLSCGDAEHVNLDGDAGPGGAGDGGGGAVGTDAGIDGDAGTWGGPCDPQSSAQCNNCVDDDGDGLVDGDDPHCSGPRDDDEQTFATGIPGDNSDPRKQDCFFDGNSGMCQIHTCCLLPDPCDEATYGSFDRETDCDLDARCVEDCAPLAPPGCDCFGCCTVCAPGTGECVDILAGLSSGCPLDDLSSDACVECVKSTACSGGGCDPAACILCPGQTEVDLPADCNGANQCPGGEPTCAASSDCEGDAYCVSGCCVGVVVD